MRFLVAVLGVVLAACGGEPDEPHKSEGESCAETCHVCVDEPATHIGECFLDCRQNVDDNLDACSECVRQHGAGLGYGSDCAPCDDVCEHY